VNRAARFDNPLAHSLAAILYASQIFRRYNVDTPTIFLIGVLLGLGIGITAGALIAAKALKDVRDIYRDNTRHNK
jgi:hypothetical protein